MFAIQGQCYASPAEALAGFRLLYPMFGDVNYVSHVSSSVSASGLLTYSVAQRPITGTTTVNRTGTMQLTQCTETQTQVAFDPVSASGIFVFFFASVVSLWFLSKNIGTILDAVKRF